MSKKFNTSLASKTVSINRSIVSVFEFLSNHENYIQWFPQVVSIEAADNLPHGTVGKIYKETLLLPNKRHKSMTIQVIESESPVLFITEGNFKPIHPRMEIRLSASSAQVTVVNLKFFSRNQSLIGRLLIPIFLKKIFARQSELGLRKLKDSLEKQTL